VRVAVSGQRELQNIVENPSADTDHNEQIWMRPPSLRHVKTVFIQKQLDRPPRLEKKTRDELTRERDRRQRRLQTLTSQEREIVNQHRRGEITHPEMVRQRARIMSRRRKLTEPIQKHRVIDQSARLPKELRLPSYWRNGRPPKGYERLEGLRGAGGKSFSELVLHVPPGFKRAMLPKAAKKNLQRAIRAGRRPNRPPQLYPPPRFPDPRKRRNR